MKRGSTKDAIGPNEAWRRGRNEAERDFIALIESKLTDLKSHESGIRRMLLLLKDAVESGRYRK